MNPVVPPNFTDASSGYRTRAWMAMLGLVGFLILYLGLASWFTYTAYRLLKGMFAGGDGAAAGFFSALPALFLALFMWKALFSLGRKSEEPGIEITPQEEPELFKFIYEIADEIGAPRPYRVFLSPDVNAFVYYDLSFWNLIFPSRKNLAIGLGLVNVLNRSEFKAVLAHEFGHFAQRTMAVGRWVYTGQQIAGNIIARRDFLDRGLQFLSSFDLRLAWIGWIMEFIVWSIRSLMETVFGWVVVTHRALSREMEFQADRVAVSVTGSDAIVHALYKLPNGDSNWNYSLEFARVLVNDGKIPPDLYEIQDRIGNHINRIVAEPIGEVPELPTSNQAAHRIFREEIAQPPQMWSTHPPNTAREENAKRIYIPSEIDDASAWTLMSDKKQLSEKLSRYVLDSAHRDEGFSLATREESNQAVDEDYEHTFLDPQFQGVYLYGRKMTMTSKNFEQWIGHLPVQSELQSSIESLYPESIGRTVVQLNKLNSEIELLEGIQRGDYEATGDQLTYQGEVIGKNEVPKLIETVKAERDNVLGQLEDHDRRARSTHYAAAQQVGAGWPQYLKSLCDSVHYIDHRTVDFNDAMGHLFNITHVSLAGRASEARIGKIIQSANEVHKIMAGIFKERQILQLPESAGGHERLQKWLKEYKFDLPPADRGNIQSWLEVIGGWSANFSDYLVMLREVVLSELLRTEDIVAESYLAGIAAPPAPNALKVPSGYGLRLRGSERPLEELGWWAKFKAADGTVAKIARFAVAAAVVFAAVALGSFVGSSSIYVYNGLATKVSVKINDMDDIQVRPMTHRKISIGTARHCLIECKSTDGRMIESFDVPTDAGYSNYIYNVGGGAALAVVTTVYGNAKPVEPVYLGFPRWHHSSAQHQFEDPPKQLKTDNAGATRSALYALSEYSPDSGLTTVKTEEEFRNAIQMHARWDDPESTYFDTWLNLAQSFEDYEQIIEERLTHQPHDVALLRLAQEYYRTNRPEKLEAHRKMADNAPENPDLNYIAVRAMPDGEQQDEAFLALYEKWPSHPWSNLACGYIFATRNQWETALACFDLVYNERVQTDHSATLAARIVRYLDTEGKLPPGAYNRSTVLKQFLDFESGQAFKGTPNYVYSRIFQGELEAATRSTRNNPAAILLLGCSEGANERMQQRALDINLEDLNGFYHSMYLLALAKRNGVDVQPYLQRCEELATDREEDHIRILTSLLNDGVSDDVVAKVETMFLQDRAIMSCVAIVMYPDQPPADWRKVAVRMLFGPERPYIQF